MRYLGGKHWISGQLSEVILPLAAGRRILEPFCGGLSMTVALQPAVASDASEPLINLIQSVRDGWEPPDEVSEEMYREVKAGPHDVMWCYVGLCCTWGGKWWGGYPRPHERQRSPTGAAKRRLLEQIRLTQEVQFKQQSYEQLDVQYGDVVYCDPPYKGTTMGYAGAPSFDHDAFWDWVDYVSQHALVLVSEFSAPKGIDCIAKFPRKVNVRAAASGGQEIDKLFRKGE